MNFKLSIVSMLTQLKDILSAITDKQYTTQISLLSNSTIGQHTRHIVEFYLELNNGYETGIVNYDNRKRDQAIETDRDFAIEKLNELTELLTRSDRKMKLIANYGTSADNAIMVSTNFYRELIYNLEHTVHHMALLRVAVSSVSTLSLPENFGVAIATLQFRKACAQ
ncbi:MAG: hypothetical protein ABIS69_06985 [Sediminibacterium sp.]